MQPLRCCLAIVAVVVVGLLVGASADAAIHAYDFSLGASPEAIDRVELFEARPAGVSHETETPVRLTGGASHAYVAPIGSRVGVSVSISAENPFPQVKAGGGGVAWSATGVEGTSTTPSVLTYTPSAPGTAIRQVGRHLESVDDVFANPQLLAGEGPGRVRSILGDTPGWVQGGMRQSTSAPGGGWTFRELNRAGTDFTDRYIQWHPGSPRHFGGQPYWKISSGSGGTVRIPQ